MSSPTRAPDRESGFSLIEVCVAMLLIAIALSAVAQLFVISLAAQDDARVQSMTTILANQKIEELRGLVWTIDQNGVPISDRSSDLSVSPATAGGSGLNASPVNSLDVNTPEYVDYLDGNGTWVGTGSSAPRNARYIRRWCIQPLPADPQDAVVLQVLVTTVTNDRHARTSRGRLPGDALVTTVRTRKAH
ncbi:MAG TPA: prepilin-type N-terminal cleavage/methylation domain-containing protein [Vicinamibacterales bacterium]|nr:prepilin-type N-terminal cleavage/methylation domain-containing protein [Vicinamibacterales bacterium]